MDSGARREAHLPAERHRAQAAALFSCPHGSCGRCYYHQAPSGTGAEGPFGLTNGREMSVSVSSLKRRDEFLRAAAGRRKWGAPGLVLQVLWREGDTEDVRVGFTVSKKVGGAVER